MMVSHRSQRIEMLSRNEDVKCGKVYGVRG
jgi:hypothetical protein